MPHTYEQRHALACKVCQNVPDEDGYLEHGRGCYTQDADGGGSEWVDLAELGPPEEPPAVALDMADEPEYVRPLIAKIIGGVLIALNRAISRCLSAGVN